MKKIVGILTIFILIGIAFISTYLYFNVEATSISLYSKVSPPSFYGLTYAEIKTGSSFNINDSIYRIFAQDFEDGDLTHNIKSTNNVNPNKAGTYYINYEVEDNDKNKSTLEVKIKVIDNLEYSYFERTIYSLPSLWNMDLVGINRGNYHDSQMLGLIINNNDFSIKELDDNHRLVLKTLNDDMHHEKLYTLSDEYTKISSEYEAIPFIKTPIDVTKDIKIGIKIKSDDINPLPYYHYLDNEEKFLSNWHNSFSVIESEYLTMLVPFKDKKNIRKDHKSIDDLLKYYQKVIDTFDEFIGLELNPKNFLNQNVRTKFFIKPNINGWGTAYYAWDHIGFTSDSIEDFFNISWIGLHELAHGYQGSLKESLNLEEVSNNILAYYIQDDSSIYTKKDKWLNINKVNLDQKDFNKLSDHDKLYVLINLLNMYEPQKVYAEINRLWRENVSNNWNYKTEDIFALTFYNLYHVDISPYFKNFNITLNKRIKTLINDGEKIEYKNRI